LGRGKFSPDHRALLRVKNHLAGPEYVPPGSEPSPWALLALRYVSYADRFGFTPAEVDEIPAWLDGWMPPLHDLILEMRRPKGGQGAQ
jgi:hypothetical protein